MKYTILEKLTALREKLSVRKAGTRLLALLLALVLLQGDFMLPAYSAEEDSGETTEQSTATNDSIVPSVQEQVVQVAPAPLADNAVVDEGTKIWTVTIDYVYAASSKFAGQRVAVPYIAEIADGDTFDDDKIATSPNCVGYTPNQASINLSTLGEITADVHLKVEYSPAQVSYTVRHYLQNVADDDYTWADTTMATGYTEALTSDAVAKNYTGFTALPHYHEEIAADSSTMIDIYYDREYYLMSFNLDGGHGVDPIYARYGTPISVGTPYRAGWTFDKWDNTIPSTMPAEDRTYTASWIADPNGVTYTIAYWLEDANDAGKYNFWESTQLTGTAGNTVQGETYKDYTKYLDTTTVNAMDTYEKRYSYYDHADTDVVIKGDGSTVVNVYYNRNEYTLKFYYAASTGSGNNAKYYVVGGSTYRFGASATISNTGSEIALLDHYMNSYASERGQVDELPSLNTIGNTRNYTTGSDSSTVNGIQYKYHYISFAAKYGEDISGLWPCGVFSSVTRLNTANDKNNTSWNGTEAFVSAWNGEHHVLYSQNSTINKGNQTIKGNYNELDYKLLWDYTQFGDSSTVAYLCFWENGADISWSIPELYRYNIYVPVLPGQDTTGLTTKTEENGTTYYLWATYDTVDDSKVDAQTDPAINGYQFDYKKGYPITNPDGSKYAEAWEVNFFYSRKTHTLSFVNGSTTVKTETLPFGTNISNLAPTGLEYYVDELKNLYVFGGWYTSPACLDGSEFELTNATMPNSHFNLYAKWDLITYPVTIHLTEGGEQIGDDLDVTHDTPVPDEFHPDPTTLKHPTDETATFIGWFYRDENDNEQAFDFATMNVLQGVTVYAKWRSNKMKQVEIHYIVIEGGAKVQIADTETLMLRLGQTRTFEAKTGSSLYEHCRTGYFPTTASHSITPVEANFNTNDPIVYEFVYKYYSKVPYQVKYYVQKDGEKWPAFKTDVNGKAVFVEYGQWNNSDTEYIDKHLDNDKAIVTELYIPENLATPTWTLPDAYLPNALKIQQIIVPSADDPENNIAANTIEFIYTYTDPEDDILDPSNPGNPSYQSRYLVQHFIQNSTDLNQYDLYRFSDETGLSGTTVTATPISIPGYSFNFNITEAYMSAYNAARKWNSNVDKNALQNALTPDPHSMSGTITADDKLELNFYYTVNSYPYQVMYLEDVTNRVLAPTKTTDAGGNTLKGRYGSSVTETAISLEGYDIVGADTKSIYIQMEAGDTANVNTIVFYYKQKSAELVLTKKVQLDPTQAEQEGISEIPAWVYNQEFVFTVYNADGFPKSVYDYTFTDANGVESEKTVIAGVRTIEVMLKHGEIIEFHDFPMGTYTVTETYVPGFNISVNNYIAQTHSVTLDTDGASETLNFLNSFPFYTGDLVLMKTVTKLDSSDPSATEPYKVTIVLTPHPDSREVHRVITFVDGNGNPVTDADGNHSVTIPKLTGSDDQTKFTIDVMVPVDGEVKLKDVPVGSFTAEEVPKGTVGYIYDFYSVRYTKAFHQNDVNSSNNHIVEGSIHGGHPTAVTFNNTYKKGSLTINKTVTQEYVNDNWQNDTFTFTITGTTELPDGSYTVDGAQVNVSSGIVTVKDQNGNNPTISITKTDGATEWSGSLSFENLPAGYYTVTETSGLGDTAYTAVVPGELLVNDVANATNFDFINTYKHTTGNLQVSKEIKIVTDGSVIDTEQDFTFVIEPKDITLSGSYACTFKNTSDNTVVTDSASSLSVNDGKLTFKLKHNQYILISGLPVGNYLVKEIAIDGYDSSFGDVQTEPGRYSVDPATITTNTTTVLNCQNAYPVYYSNLIVKKSVVTPVDYSAVDQAPADDLFTFTVTISDYSDKISLTGGIGAKFYDSAEDITPFETALTVTDNAVTFTLKNGEWVNLNLPACNYTIEETGIISAENSNVLSDHYTTTCAVGETTGTTNVSSVLTSGEIETVVFTNTYKRHYADLTIIQNGMQKATDSGIYKIVNASSITVATIVIHSNNSATIKDLPVGNYTVTELTSWIYEYSTLSPSISVEVTSNSTAIFTNNHHSSNWLDGECYKDNNFN